MSHQHSWFAVNGSPFRCRHCGVQITPVDAPKPPEAPEGEEYTLMDALRASAGRPPLPKPAPAPEPKQGSEEPPLGTVEPLSARQITALRAELAQAREEIANHKTALDTLEILYNERGDQLAAERAAREREKAHFYEQWTLEEARFLEMLHRAGRAEATVIDLEKAIVDWETEPQYRVTNLNWLHRVAKDIMARAKEGEKR